MKKITSFLLVICTCIYCFLGCSNGGNNNPSNLNSTVKIVYPDGTEESHVFKANIENQITPRYENGKVLVGYYSSNDATGIEYINFLGTSVKWSYSYPSTLFAIYEDADYSKTFTSKILRDENPYDVLYHKGVEFTFDSFCDPSSSSNVEDFAKLLYSNPNAEIKITMYATVKGYYHYSDTAKLGIEIGIDKINTFQTSCNDTSYKTIKVVAVVKAKQLISGTNTVIARVYPSVYVKNIYFTAEFAN